MIDSKITALTLCNDPVYNSISSTKFLFFSLSTFSISAVISYQFKELPQWMFAEDVLHHQINRPKRKRKKKYGKKSKKRRLVEFIDWIML